MGSLSLTVLAALQTTCQLSHLLIEHLCRIARYSTHCPYKFSISYGLEYSLYSRVGQQRKPSIRPITPPQDGMLAYNIGLFLIKTSIRSIIKQYLSILTKTRVSWLNNPTRLTGSRRVGNSRVTCNHRLIKDILVFRVSGIMLAGRRGGYPDIKSLTCRRE